MRQYVHPKCSTDRRSLRSGTWHRESRQVPDVTQPPPTKGSLTMTTREVVEQFLGLLGAGDPDAVAQIFADEIDWYVPGSDRLPWTGRRTTPAEVADYLRVLGENIVPEENIDKVEALVVEGRHAVLLGSSPEPREARAASTGCP